MAGLKKCTAEFVSAFFLLFIVFFPLTSVSGNLQVRLTRFIFGFVSNSLSSLLFGPTAVSDFSSDSKSMFSLLLVLAIISVLAVVFLHFAEIKITGLIGISRLIVTYYLVLVLLKYGIDKVTMMQFYSPEPNILFTRFGNLDRDILYWSVMGTSRTYSVFLGLTEVLCAIFLFWKRTRNLGFVLTFLVLANVLMVNIAFHISVKIFSAILLVMTVFAMYPSLKPLYDFFVRNKQAVLESNRRFRIDKLERIAKIVVIVLFTLAIVAPAYSTDNSISEYCGAYEIVSIKKEGNPVDLGLSRIFIHKKNYLIFQSKDETMKDFHFESIRSNGDFEFEDYNRKLTKANVTFSTNGLTLRLLISKVEIKAQKINWPNMPALRDDSHFFVDDVR